MGDEVTRQMPLSVLHARDVAFDALKIPTPEEDIDTETWSPEEGGDTKTTGELSFQQFRVDFMMQRQVLDAENRALLEDMWGWDAMAGRFKGYQNKCFGMNVENLLRREIKYADTESKSTIARLKTASDDHIGLEIIHRFVVDLLGRDTPAAKIFRSKTEEDFRQSMVVTSTAKHITWLLIFLINLFFVYFTLLRAMQRDNSWQRGFLMACVLQFVIEVFFYETVECLWINFSIPRLVCEEVESVIAAFNRTVDFAFSRKITLPVLDAPKYFFVSHRIAKAHPQLFDSKFILAYHTMWPGIMCTKWKEGASATTKKPSLLVLIFKRFSISLSVGLLMKYVGALPMHLQKLIFHLALPIIFTALLLLGTVLVESPYYALAFLVLVAYEAMGYLMRRRKRSAVVTPGGGSPGTSEDFTFTGATM